jgi:hypothetical protein
MANTYDPKNYFINFGGQSIKNGIADGTFINITRNARQRSVRVGSDGGATIQVDPNRSATITLTYLAGSDTNTILDKMRESEDATPAIYKVGTFQLSYLNGDTFAIDNEAFIDGPPDITGETGESTRTWTIICPSIKMNSRGTDAPIRIGGVGNV